MATPEKISLYCTEGSSDKEYHLELLQDEATSLWMLKFKNGRRGQALRGGDITKSPVPYEDAKKEYDRRVKSKLKDGYTPNVDGAIYQDTIAGEDFSGFVPQLPTDIRNEETINEMMRSEEWILQQKYDGENRQISSDGTTVKGINKRGIFVPLPVSLADAFSKVPSPFLGSGEIIGEKLYLFDVQEYGGKDLRSLPFIERHAFVEKAASDAGGNVVAVECAVSYEDKKKLVESIKSKEEEGVVFKKANAPFASGKLSPTAATQFKWKFTEDCTVRVSAVSKTKRSVSMEIDDENKNPIPLGSVTIPLNQEIPNKGDLISVNYLHLFEGGSLFQSTYKGVRVDCDGPDSLDQFKVKRKEPELETTTTKKKKKAP